MKKFFKSGPNEIRPFKKNGKWIFELQNQTFDLAPADIVNVVLSPLIIGVDRLIVLGCEAKKIKNAENGFILIFSDQFLPASDVKLKYREAALNGWIYDVEGLNLEGVMPGQKAWICPQMGLFFSSVPLDLYLKIESS